MQISPCKLLRQLLYLDRTELTQELFLDSWTVKDVLAHIGAWDRWEHRQMERLMAGKRPERVGPESFNDVVVAQWRDEPLSAVVEEVRAARRTWLTWLDGIADGEFFRHRPRRDWDWTFPNTLKVQWEHDAEHAAQIAAWRRGRGSEHDVGPKPLLIGALEAARRELLTAAARVPVEVRTSRPVCGVWTLHNLVGHLADWEHVGVAGLRMMAEGRAPDVEEVSDIDAWNRERVEARRHQTWDDVWTDLHQIRAELMAVLKGMGQERLPCWYHFPWGGNGTAYDWLTAFVTHDSNHAQDIRKELEGSAPA